MQNSKKDAKTIASSPMMFDYENMQYNKYGRRKTAYIQHPSES